MKRCVICDSQFEPESRRQKLCGDVECAVAYPRWKRAQEQRKANRRALREYRRKEAQRKSGNTGQDGRFKSARGAANDFVRERDYFEECIVHGAECPNKSLDHGWDAGHFIPVEQGGPLRLNMFNMAKQCSQSNAGARYRRKTRDTVSPKFEAGMIRRHGRARVAWLKGPHPEREFTDEYLARFARIFRKRAQQYRARRERRLAMVEALGISSSPSATHSKP